LDKPAHQSAAIVLQMLTIHIHNGPIHKKPHKPNVYLNITMSQEYTKANFIKFIGVHHNIKSCGEV